MASGPNLNQQPALVQQFVKSVVEQFNFTVDQGVFKKHLPHVAGELGQHRIIEASETAANSHSEKPKDLTLGV